MFPEETALHQPISFSRITLSPALYILSPLNFSQKYVTLHHDDCDFTMVFTKSSSCNPYLIHIFCLFIFIFTGLFRHVRPKERKHHHKTRLMLLCADLFQISVMVSWITNHNVKSDKVTISLLYGFPVTLQRNILVTPHWLWFDRQNNVLDEKMTSLIIFNTILIASVACNRSFVHIKKNNFILIVWSCVARCDSNMKKTQILIIHFGQ